MQTSEAGGTGGAAPPTTTPPAPTSARLRGIALGRERTVPLVEKLRDKRPDETAENYAAFEKRWGPYLGIQVTVRHQSRRKVQLAAMRMDAIAGGAKREEEFDITRAFLAEHVVDPKTGQDFGPVLVKVTGAEAELPDGRIVDLGEVRDTELLLDLLEDMGLLDTVGGVAATAQQPTRVQGN